MAVPRMMCERKKRKRKIMLGSVVKKSREIEILFTDTRSQNSTTFDGEREKMESFARDAIELFLDSLW